MFKHMLLNINKMKCLKPQSISQSLSLHTSFFTSPSSGAHEDNHGSGRSKPRPIVMCGPSGCGKSTLLKRLTGEFKDSFMFSVSHTTRSPRKGEIDGKEYHFVDKQSMEKAIKNGEFIEYTAFSGNYYGTSKESIRKVQEANRICILDVEIDGVKNLKKTDLNARYIFVKPPDMQVLEKRLRHRGTENEENILRRLERAKDEMAYGNIEGNFDIVIVNDVIEQAYLQLKEFLIDEIKQLEKLNSNSN